MNKKIVKDALILTAFTLVLGFVLGLVYEITKDPIAQAKEAATQAAYQEVFPDAQYFEAMGDFDKEAAAKIVTDAGYADEITDVQTAYDSQGGQVLGYVITVTAKDASQANITFSVGIRNDGTINGYSITDIAETPGLGMHAQDEDFIAKFQNKKVDAFTVVKTTPTSDSEIEAITSATITTKAIANGVNACIVYFQNELAGGAVS
ncbi:MAG: RnfABCDGE type electron transport complex subunit G [Lachnospiraceae bacterium]|nr:RnfABCDGE type electron transport complex subunit G [Lachnospiraceae bacterium]MDE7436393.1 RnfABCDGE type electron transport complex subunit G [Lachnospiraceae bacterium]